jgi:O-acetyl-ADP-ribose deacetylase (regulator of RNase III)
MKIIEQDLLKIHEGIICHQVNLLGVAGGLAGAIFRKYPEAFKKYKQFCKDKSLKLGFIQPTLISRIPYLVLANLAGQEKVDTYGRQTDYDALSSCFQKVSLLSTDLKLPLYFPYRIGCGLGGGDWDIVCDLIKTYCPDAVICKSSYV